MDVLKLNESTDYSKQTFENRILTADCSISASFSQATFHNCEFRSVQFDCTTFADATFTECRFYNTKFVNSCSFERASLTRSYLEGVHLVDINLDRATVAHCEIKKCHLARVRGSSVIEQIRLDRKSKLTQCVFDKLLSDIDSYRLILRNTRMTRWSQWYQKHPLGKHPVKVFWWLSDYGSSTARLMILYALSIVGFQQLYLLPWYFGKQSLIHDIDSERATFWLIQVRSLYFSAVTSTVGFSYLGPLKESTTAHLIVISQVVFAYLIIGAILARIAALVQE